MIHFVVQGEPVAKARARSRVRTRKDGSVVRGKGNRPVITHYTPKISSTFENLVATEYYSAGNCGEPLTCPVAIQVKAFFRTPQSTPKKRLPMVRDEIIPVVKKPDCDNILKSVLDGLNKVAFLDDKQVYSVTCEKYYSLKPRTEITIRGNV